MGWRASTYTAESGRLTTWGKIADMVLFPRSFVFLSKRKTTVMGSTNRLGSMQIHPNEDL